MRNSLPEFLLSPPPGWGGVFTLFGIGIVGSLLASIISLLTENSVWWIGLSMFSILVLMVAVFWTSRRIKPRILVPEDEMPQIHRGLILLVGPGRPGEKPENQSAWPSIDYHLSNKPNVGLQICWLIATSGEKGSLPVAQSLKEYCKEKRVTAYVKMLPDPFSDSQSVQNAYELVNKIYAEEIGKVGLTEAQVVADFTGGVKTTSAGMILACGDHRPMQYMYGRKEGVASTPILIKFSQRGM